MNLPSLARQRRGLLLRALGSTGLLALSAPQAFAQIVRVPKDMGPVTSEPPARHCTQGSTPGVGGLPAGSVLKVLWVGNSLTNTAPDHRTFDIGPMPARLAPMLAELGVTLKWDAIIRGGAEYADHARQPAYEAKLAQETYDAVNLQGYYQGYGSADQMVAAVRSLHEAAQRRGTVVLLQQMWSFHQDPNSPQFPRSALAVEEASDRLPGSIPVQILRVWHAVRLEDPELYLKLFADNVHQSAAGEHLNALAFARFFTARSVQPVRSVHPLVAARLNPTELQRLKDVVDRQVRVFYRPLAALRAETPRCPTG